MTQTPPRPILKRSQHSHSAPRPAVHFPPSPVLTRTFAAHSPASYDRSPIVVAPNACALPARGCPGRTYLPLDADTPATTPAAKVGKTSGRHVHPRRCNTPPASDNGGSSGEGTRAFPSLHAPSPPPPPPASPSHPRRRARSRSPSPPPPLPALVADLSSESDESDGFIAPLLSELDAASPFFAPRPRGDFLNGPQLAFLPHSPAREDPPPDKPRKPRPRTRRGRVAVAVVGGEGEGGRYKSLAGCSLKSCELEVKDEGCLAGF